jgi:hypothetical protein
MTGGTDRCAHRSRARRFTSPHGDAHVWSPVGARAGALTRITEW